MKMFLLAANLLECSSACYEIVLIVSEFLCKLCMHVNHFFAKAIWNNNIAHTYNLLLYLSFIEKILELCCDLPKLVLLLKLVLLIF
jgi:hypothetical protein